MGSIEAEIRAMVDRETAAWDNLDADALVSLFHPDTVWPWPPHATAHDPAEWVLPWGRFNRERWRAGWVQLFETYELVRNNRRTIRIVASAAVAMSFALPGKARQPRLQTLLQKIAGTL